MYWKSIDRHRVKATSQAPATVLEKEGKKTAQTAFVYYYIRQGIL
jgi:hypothetical protein